MILALSLAAAPAVARPLAVGTVNDPVRGTYCHYASEADRDACLNVLGWVEEAWAVQVDELGFAAPIPDGALGGSAGLDVYLSSEGTGGPGGAYVICDGEQWAPCVDVTPGDGRNGATAYMVIDPGTDAAVFRQYVHHEFQHVTQYATDFTEPSLSTWEGTAMAAERWTDAAAPLDAWPVADYQAAPWASAVLQDGYFLDDAYGFANSWYEYGACAWLLWLDAQHGDGTGSVGPALWSALAQEGAENEPDVLDAWDVVAGGGRSAGAWKGDLPAFEAERMRMGTDAGPEYVAFAGSEAYAWREGMLDAEDSVSPTMPPFPLGMSLWDMDAHAGATVRLTVAGDDAVEWAILAVQGAESALWTGADVASGDAAWTPAEDGGATIGVLNLGAPSMDADDALETASFTLTVTTDTSASAARTPAACGCNVATMASRGAGFSLLLPGFLALITGLRRRA